MYVVVITQVWSSENPAPKSQSRPSCGKPTYVNVVGLVKGAFTVCMFPKQSVTANWPVVGGLVNVTVTSTSYCKKFCPEI